MTYEVRVLIDEKIVVLQAEHGTNLRQLLLQHAITPYAPIPNRVNCGGRGICATCGVWIEAGEPAPTHWHDQLAARFGYPRLSCQIAIREAMTVRILTDKVIWGSRRR